MATAPSRRGRTPTRIALVARLSHDLEWIGPQFIGPAAVAVIGLGIWLTPIEDWIGFSQTWIWLSLVLVGVSMILGIGYFATEGKRIGRTVAERGRKIPTSGAGSTGS